MSQIIVRMEDVRAAGLCTRGAKRWLEGRGLRFRVFLNHGMPLADLEAMNDGMGNKVAQYVRDKSKGTT